MDNDLIQRAAARDVINTWGRHENEDVRMDLLHNDLNAIPAVDAAPVVHGRWMTCEDGWGDLHYQCSKCGCEWFLEDGSPADNDMNYCPHCGAKMDE